MAVRELNLSLETIRQLDPRLAILFEKQIKAITNDCYNRPHDKKPRKVSLEVIAIPVPGNREGMVELDNVDIKIQIKSVLPTFHSNNFSLRANDKGLAFNADFPSDPNQMPLPFSEQNGEE